MSYANGDTYEGEARPTEQRGTRPTHSVGLSNFSVLEVMFPEAASNWDVCMEATGPTPAQSVRHGYGAVAFKLAGVEVLILLYSRAGSK